MGGMPRLAAWSPPGRSARLRGGVCGGSAEGGREELVEFWPSRASSACTRACNCSAVWRHWVRSAHSASMTVWASGRVAGRGGSVVMPPVSPLSASPSSYPVYAYHADYAETQASLITRSSEGITFRNPGSSRVPESDLLVGDRSDPRNPNLVFMFRSIGLAEEAGTGIPKILRAWRELGFHLPDIDVGTERHEFKLTLRHAHLLSTDDRAWLLSMGENWSEAEQLALVVARHEGHVDNVRLRRLTGQHASDTTKVLVSLRDRDLLQMAGAGRGARYELSALALTSTLPAVSAAAEVAAENQLSFIPLGEGSINSAAGSDNNGEGSTNKEGGFVNSGTIRESSSARLPWSELLEIADPIRARQRIAATITDDVVVRLCSRAALSVRDLAKLTNRTPANIHYVLRRLTNAERLTFLYPEKPNHPGQRYIAAASSGSSGATT